MDAKVSALPHSFVWRLLGHLLEGHWNWINYIFTFRTAASVVRFIYFIIYI